MLGRTRGLPALVAMAGLLAAGSLVWPGGASPAHALANGDAGSAGIGTTTYDVPAGARFVAPNGRDRGAGTQSQPWRTVGHAVEEAPDGSTIVIREGVYHESVAVFEKRLTLQSYPGEVVWFDGSVRIDGFVAEGSVWRKDGWTPKFNRQASPPELVTAEHPYAAYPDMVFLEGVPLQQVGSRSDVKPGTFFVDYGTSKLYIGNDPSGKAVRGSALADALHIGRGDGSVIRGIGFRRYATPTNEIGTVKIYSDRAVVENCLFTQNAFAGLSLSGNGIRVSDVTARDNGQLGVHANWADNLTLERTLVQSNNAERFADDQAAGGIKFTASRGVRIRNNVVRNNIGNGIWLDRSSYDVWVAGNRVYGNARHGVQFELSAAGVIVDNAISNNQGRGVYILDANSVEIFNNVISTRGDRAVFLLDGPRTSSDTTHSGHNTRRPIPDPDITWEVTDVRLRNNVLMAPSGEALLAVDDSTRKKRANDQNISANNNAYYRPGGSPEVLATWANYPDRLVVAENLDELRSGTGQERNGLAADGPDNPFVEETGSGGFRVASDSPGDSAGQELPDRVGQAAGSAPSPVDIGPLTNRSGPTPSPSPTGGGGGGGGGGGQPSPSPSPTQPGGEPQFSDTAGTTHERAIRSVAREGIALGYADGTFGPGRPVTRGQMATFLVRALDLPAAPSSGFRDVRGTTHEKAIDSIVAAGITTGYADGTYGPQRVVTRGQMATFLTRALELPSAPSAGFRDTRGTTHERSVDAVFANDIAFGYPDGTYRPGAAVSRGQMATFLARALGLPA